MTITFPQGFLWGAASAAHQVEGGNWNNDWWEFEHRPDTPCAVPSGDCCDHFWRYPDDIRMLADLGFGAYRFSIEWSRIEPEDGEFSKAALEHYRRMIACCRENDLVPVVTFHHFSSPRWLAARGGWTNPAVVDSFARFCDRAVAHLGDLVGIACTINEPNIVSLMGYLVGVFPPGRNDLAEFATVNEHLKAAHRKSYDVIKGGPGDFPVGQCIALGDWWAPEGAEEKMAEVRHMHEGQHLEACRGDDFVGVQAYSRARIGPDGMPLPPEEGVEVVTSMGYEFWPQSLEVAIRHAADVAQVPVIVTENGLGHDDDGRRVAYVTDALRGLVRCLDDGVDVRGYFYWSLTDNFEWALGYGPRFGLVEIDWETQQRTPKPSARWLGEVARTNHLET